MRVEVLDEAEQDLVDGARFYEAQEGNVAQVWALLDCRQDPEQIVRRLTQRRS